MSLHASRTSSRYLERLSSIRDSKRKFDDAAGQSTAKLVPKTRKLSAWDNTFTVIVGPEKKPYIIHQDVLGASSTFFKNAIKPEWNESRSDPRTIDMSHCDEDAFSTYAHWLYSKSLPAEDITKPTVEDIFNMSKAYVLGEELLDTKFKNAIVDSFIFSAESSAVWPGIRDIKIIYIGTTSSSPGRRFMVDLYAYHINNVPRNGWEDVLKGCPAEFLVAVLLKMSELRQPSKLVPWPATHHTYYEDEEVAT